MIIGQHKEWFEDKSVRNVMIENAKDFLYYGYSFKSFMTNDYCIAVGEENSKIIWNQAIEIMGNEF